MKNSLFKRAMAVASAVPLALTQCLGVANAVDVTDAAPAAGLTGATATLNDGSEGALFYIEPNETNEKYTVSEDDGNYTFTKDSVWYSDVYSILAQIGNGSKNSGTIKATSLFDYALNRAGRYRDIAEGVVDCIGEMKYTVDANGDVTIKGEMNNVVPVFEAMGQKMVGDSLQNLADKYDMPELADVEFFEGLEIAGSIEIAVSSSSLNDGTSTSAVFTFTDKVTGAQYKGTAVLDYVKAQLETIETVATTKIDSLVEKYDLTDEEFEAMVQDSDEYRNLIANLKDGYTPEDGEIEAMILESVEFKNLVTDYMNDHGIDYAEAEAKVMDSDEYKDMIERFTNGLNLDEATIKSILSESPEYEQLVNDYMEANQVDYNDAVDAVLQSEDYQNLLAEFTDKYTYTDEEIEAIVKGTDTYVNKLASLKAEYKDLYAKMTDKADSIENRIVDISTFFTGKMNTADKYIDKAMNFSGSKSADSITPIIEAANKRIPVVTSKVENVSEKLADRIEGRQIPTSGAAIAANATVQKFYSEVINQILASSPVAVDIEAADWGELVDEFTEITVSAEKGVATLTAQLPDKEVDEAIPYIESEYGVEVLKEKQEDGSDVYLAYKEIAITVDFASIETDGSVSYDMNLKRVVKATEKEVVSSSTTDTSTTASTETTPTETTPTDTNTSETGTTPTETTPTDTNTSETGTTPTETTPTDTNTSETGTTPTDTTPTDTNTSETGTTPTDTTPTDTNTSETGTTPTDTTPTDTNTSSTGTETTVSGDPSTTTAVVKSVVNFETETEVGFYLDTDKEFNKEQISSLSYSVDLSTVYYDAEGNVLGQEVNVPGEKIDILNSVEFKDVPSVVYENINKDGVARFASQIPVYAKENITAADGTVVANAGDILKNLDGSSISVTAYIGVKGDADLDMKADSSDASVVLVWYAAMQTGKPASETQFSTNDILVQSDPVLDDLAAFLCDVDNENDSQNWKTRKPARTIGSDDSSFILAYYGKVMTGSTAGKDTWDVVLGEYAKK